MNKKQLIARVQRYMGPGATRNTASAAVEAVLASVLAAVKEDKKLHIAHFGTFHTERSSARRGYNLATGSIRNLPPKKHLRFRPAAHFLPKLDSPPDV